ncbi:uncharacterized protein C21orf58 [Astyanax mexicanus]|uniref:DUF4587 domain-containing protein n=2 Tax=Astyanax mexicanus TaxID=7994 RepID=A0A8B9RGK9_ASTMX|nr:uncharacterized protein C21orf58 [Astyanax mexicanus]XP_049335858.1 uncharacterized protein C21orf58 [Astyanax mexicanus]KAG9277606.1 hypothetical protein AMEX_G7626 [Astyanax mexicanus]
MVDPVVEQMTRLRLKLLEQRLENEREAHGERGNSALSIRSHDGQTDALHSALRRRRDLLRRLREQHMLEELGRPHSWAGPRKQQNYGSFPAPAAPPFHTYPSLPPPPPPAAPLPPPPPPPPRIIQQTIPQQPTTIIQQLPQQQPLIAQIPPPLPVPSRPGSIKEDMVELMLMQNAQMHQIIMHNMMLKALPPMAVPPGVPGSLHTAQENTVKARAGGHHHHHHYSPPPLPPIGYSAWPSVIPAGQGGAHQPFIHHMTGQVALPALNPMSIAGLK